jgi:hypothetical protein
MEFNFESSIRGYHVYKSIWTYEISEKLRCDREENNEFDGHVFFISIISNEFHSKFVICIIFFSVTTKFLADLVCPTGNKFFNIGFELPCTYYVHIFGTSCWCRKIKNFTKTHCYLKRNLRIKLDTNIIFLLTSFTANLLFALFSSLSQRSFSLISYVQIDYIRDNLE